MHDLHAADKIVKLALDQAKQNELEKISKIVIGLGNILEHGQTINADNLRFNIKILAENTIAKDLKIEIKKNNSQSWKLIEIEGE